MMGVDVVLVAIARAQGRISPEAHRVLLEELLETVERAVTAERALEPDDLSLMVARSMLTGQVPVAAPVWVR